jgi:hypothetical protein
MTGLYVYAVLRSPSVNEGDSASKPPVLVDCGGIDAAVLPVSAAPVVDAAALRSHDAVVRRLCERSASVLPMRFGSFVPDEAALRQWIDAVRPVLERGLDLVAGREQMGLRVYGDAGPAAPDEEDRGGADRGTRYLMKRTRLAMPAGLGGVLDVLRARLGRLVLSERVERHETPPLLATVHHLVARQAGEAYRAALACELPELQGWRFEITGPWPPYAFAPEELS